MSIVDLYILNTKDINIDILSKSSFLKNEDFAFVGKYKLEEAKKEKLLSQYLKNKYIGTYTLNELGKPITKSKFFNVSHSKGFVVLAVSNDRPVGVDIEVNRNIEDNFVKFVTNKEEFSYINNSFDFFKIWTSKESLLKCIGTGINKRMNEVPGLPIDGNREYNGQIYYTKSVIIDDLIISICLSGSDDFNIRIINEKI